jgi:nucleoside-diphosphate-sugar epimerase
LKILLTGLKSFVGNVLYKKLLNTNHEVYPISRTFSDEKNILVGDLLNEQFYETLPKKIDVVIHLASLTTPPEYDSAKLYFNNLESTRLLANFCKKNKIKKIIYTSSLSIYGDIEKEILTEDTIIKNPSPYGLSKFLGETILENFLINNTSVITLRLPAIIGKGATRHFLSKTLKLMKDDGIINIFNPSSLFNNCVHVENLCDFMMDLLNKNFDQNKIFNLASSEPLKLANCIDIISSCLEVCPKINIINNDKKSFIIDTNNAEKFGFKPLTTSSAIFKWVNQEKECRK